MSSRTIDIAALTYQTLANRLSNIKISQAALTDTLTRPTHADAPEERDS